VPAAAAVPSIDTSEDRTADMDRPKRCHRTASSVIGWFALASIWIVAARASGDDAKKNVTGPLAPEEAAAALDVFPGLEVQLFAHEPMVVNPTDMDIDARGRIWVTEGVNYRQWKGLKPEGDRIVILEDNDGDGRAERLKVFYQDPSVNAALGICVLGKHVIVSCSPRVFVFTDEDGDDRPDQKRVLFDGISGVQHDHGVHAFVFGPDGKLYFNMGNDGKELRTPSGDPVIDLAGNAVKANGKPYRQGMVFRSNFDGSAVETLGHNFRNNYEVAVDSFGTLWQSDNDDDGNRGVRINYVLEFGNFGYTDEATGAGWSAKRTNLEGDVPIRHWHQNDPGVVPNLLQTGAGSPTGICVYEGELLPEVFRGQVLHCDAGPNVVRAYPVKPNGAGYKATTVDLVKGRDSWFRPADVCVAPDGAVFIADWYDAGVGGHAMADNRLEAVRGRIYRVAPPGHKPRVPALDLESPRGAVEALKSPSLAVRYLAWQRLHELGGAAEAALSPLWKDGTPRLRARALQLLARVKGREAHYVEEAKADRDPDIRITALRIARGIGQERGLDVLALVRRLVRDPSPLVRRECAIALRHLDSTAVPELWAELALQHDGKDRWYLEALGVGAARQEDACFAAWLERAGEAWDSPAGRDIVWRSRSKDVPLLLLSILTDPATPASERLRFLRAFDFLSGEEREKVLVDLLASEDPLLSSEALERVRDFDPEGRSEHRRLLDRLLERSKGKPALVDLVRRFKLRGRADEVFDVLRSHAADSAGAAAARVLLDQGEGERLRKAIEGEDAGLGVKVAHALGNSDDDRAVALLAPLASADERDPAVVGQAARALARTRAGARKLLELAKEGKLAESARTVAGLALSMNPSREVREEARELFPPPASGDASPLPPLRRLVEMKGSAAEGEKVYDKLCADCHQVGGRGKELGPNLSEIGTKLGRDALFLSILDPNAGVSFNYEGTVLRLKPANEVVGIVVSETAESITLKTQGGIVTQYPKGDLLQRRPLNLSIMPAGLQASMSRQDLVDLVEYLAAQRKKEVGG
jgi:putative membrane-bound dehydrogenase-like protein